MEIRTAETPTTGNAEGDALKKLKRGFDVRLYGEAEKVISQVQVNTFAVQPPNFAGISPMPKLEVQEGQHV
ncbi:MAG TPA: NADH:ubiquinone reductase (Na(+)-transporting) subunit A, partial [Haliscomenobacter sp.]|nr:NADH:ubiquinone reductase (Na(+)-transporting) subunit A [Haliscomenobacter sp.]